MAEVLPVIKTAVAMGVHPGIVIGLVGRFQRDKLSGFNQLTGLFQQIDPQGLLDALEP